MSEEAIMDEFDEVVNEYPGQRGVYVIELECGHQIVTDDGTFFPW